MRAMLLVMLCLFVAAPAAAGDLVAKDHDTPVHWTRRQVTVADYTPAPLSAYVQKAAKDWTAATGGALHLNYVRHAVTGCEAPIFPLNGEIAVCASTQRVGLSGSTQWFTDGTVLYAALIKIYGPVDEPGLAWTVPHEFGHAVGLTHSFVDPSESVMVNVWPSPARGPLSHDIAVVKPKYHFLLRKDAPHGRRRR